MKLWTIDGIVGEVDDLVGVVHVRDLRCQLERRVVGAGELHLPLAGEEDHLPVQDAAGEPVAHRDAGGLELIVLRDAGRVRGAAPRIHQQADLDAALPRLTSSFE